MSVIRVGTYVTHSQRPAWGVGKVFGLSPQHVLVGFSSVPVEERFKRMELRPGLLDRAEIKQDAELDSWKVECDSTCHYIGAIEKPRRSQKAPLMTREQAMECFVNKFHGGFPDRWYRSTHRDPRVAQQEAFAAQLPPDRLRALAGSDPRAAGDILLELFDDRAHPLLHLTNELPRLKEAFADVHHLPAFLVALADVIEAERPDAKTFEAYIAALGAFAVMAKRTPLTWPIVTALPAVAQPLKYMFVKATPTSKAAATLGFTLKLNRKPDWPAYERVLGMGQNLLEFITPRSGVDLFDVQAFITAVAE